MSDRFAFGKNWSNFLHHIDDTRITRAAASLQTMLAMENLGQKTFVDVGCGSGLFSLAARRLGANVISFDYDPECVACTAALKQKYLPDDAGWKILQGSALDETFLRSLGKFNVVYSWGVLHHTGQMWKALGLVDTLVAPSGKLFIAIYNDQGFLSKVWLHIKKFYNSSRQPVRLALVVCIGLATEFAAALVRALSLRNPLPFGTWNAQRTRGMSIWYDLVDWVGGYPFEVAKPEQIFEFFHHKGYDLEKLVTKRAGQGCCEYVFIRSQ